ncbi:MAG TPA: hypothetical protein VMU59_09300 [Caulobacteraceae bacterium]|nr:hypothetical protein [Caulobacteraceae bacterium]
MGEASFINSWTSGEICDDAWDRNDIQPITKGCVEATNLIIRVAGPLGKRRGFWRLGAVADQTKFARLIPFRRSIDDALMLEFGDLTVRVWSANGSPLMNGGVQVQFASPYTQDQLAGLRFKQVADVIYIRHASGLRPYALVRLQDTVWTFNAESFPNGPWLPENADQSQFLTVTVLTGTSDFDQTPGTNAGCILDGATVTLTASQPTFHAGQVGAYFRLRQNSGAPGVKTWSTGYRPPGPGYYCGSAGLVYYCTAIGTGPLTSGVDEAVTTPPVCTSGQQSDGGNTWLYRNDGAGVVQILSVTDDITAVAEVMSCVPLRDGENTVCFAEGAYSDYRGWPRMWPSIVEERLVEGATTSNLDQLDMTETAGFDQSTETFTPGLGDGAVVDTDAIRRRVGDDGGELLWSYLSTFLLVGTASGEYIASGGLFGSPIAPSTIVVRPLSQYGSDDVFPVLAHKSLLYVTVGGQTLRKLEVDLQQNVSEDDFSFLATHISSRVFSQLAWVTNPDNVLWTRLGDGGLAAMTYHDEQQVRGWTRQQLPGGYIVEDMVTLPGPGRLETLWLVVSRQKGGATQRELWMLSQPNDGLFIDGAALYQGAATPTIGGLANFEGETVRVLANGVQYDLPVTGGQVTLPGGATTTQAQVGLGFQTRFQSLTLDVQALSGALNLRQMVKGVVVRLKTALAMVGVAGSALMERVSPRTAAQVPGAAAQPVIQPVTVGANSQRQATIVITDDTAYDHVIYSIKPMVDVGG